MNKKKILIIMGFVISALVICFSIYKIVEKKNIVDKDSKGEVLNKHTKIKEDIKNDDNTNDNEESTMIVNDVNNYSDESTSKLDDVEEKDNNKVSTNVSDEYNSNIILEDNKSNDFTFEVVDTGEKTLYHYKTNIYYKGNLIQEVEKIIVGAYQIDDIMLYIIVGSDSGYGVYAMDKNGNLLKEFARFDDELGMFGIGAWKKNPKVDGNIITFYVYTYGISCYALDQSAIVEKTYQIKYLGNNQFSDLETISSKTRKEACSDKQ